MNYYCEGFLFYVVSIVGKKNETKDKSIQSQGNAGQGGDSKEAR